MKSEKKYEIKVLQKAFNILSLFDRPGKELTATEISEELDINRASTFRILRNLEMAGFLEKDGENAKFRLGLKLYYLGRLAEPYRKIKEVARPFLERLNERCGETVHLAILHEGEALYLDKIEGRRTIRVISRVGAKLPAHCSGVGKVLLAALSEEKLEDLVRSRGLPRYTQNTITDIKALKRELRAIRKKGYAIDNEEIEDGLRCVAAPLYDSRDVVLASISISAPSERFKRRSKSFLLEVMKTADEISNAFRKKGLEKLDIY